MRGFDHATILSPSFYGLRKERQAQWPAFCVLNYDQKFRRGGNSRKIGRGCAARFLKPLVYFRPKWSKLMPYFKPKRLKKNKPFGAAQTYIAYIRDYPPGAKSSLQIMSLAAYASETNKPTGWKFWINSSH